MTQTMPNIFVLLLLMVTGGGYALATIGMKMASGVMSITAMAAIVAGLLAAVVAEMFLLRNAELPVVYLAIVVFETLLVLGYAAVVGGAVTPMQVLGAALVLGGFGLVTFQS